MQWPWPLRKPFQRKELRLATNGGVGDELMATAVFRAIKRRNPRCRISFLSRHPDLLHGMTCVDQVIRRDKDTPLPHDTVYLGFEHCVPPPRTIINILGECAGITNCAPDIEAPNVTATPFIHDLVAAIPTPRIVVQPMASNWTPVKNWPAANWAALIRRLTTGFNVIEIGNASALGEDAFGPRYTSLVGKTSLCDFAWVLSQAAVFIGPVSGGMHLARAYRVPSVIIIGGYEAPTGFNYDQTQFFYTALDCSPCWRTDSCPFGLKCMTDITPDDVYGAVMRVLPDQRSTDGGTLDVPLT